MDAVTAASAESMEKGSSSFSAAARLFGRRLREDVWQLYAWCRYCDDEIDGQAGGGASVQLSVEDRAQRLAQLRARTRSALAGAPQDEAAFAAFSRVARAHQMPEQWPLELLDGFALDVEPKPFAGQSDTLAYCWGVAGTVGVMMALIMGARKESVLRRAQDLGLAFQLTNICRDVREDAENGRVYLPVDALAAAGVPATPQALLDPQHQTAVFIVVRQHLELAEAYYRSARVGLRDLPFRGALAVAAARDVYREIGRRIVRKGPSALESRMSTPKPILVLRLLRGGLIALWSRAEKLTPPPARPLLWSRL